MLEESEADCPESYAVGSFWCGRTYLLGLKEINQIINQTTFDNYFKINIYKFCRNGAKEGLSSLGVAL